MTDQATCSPGSHPHSDRPNWQPATNADDYFRNCREGLEEYSGRTLSIVGSIMLGKERAA